MEEKDNEKVIIISAKDLIKENSIISYIKSLTAGDMVSLVIEDPDRKLTDNMLLTIASSDRIDNLEIKGNFRYKCVDGITYSKSMVELIACPAGKTGKVIIPEGVRIIKARAFSKCEISAVKLPDSIITIERSAFRWCHNLSEIDFGKGLKRSVLILLKASLQTAISRNWFYRRRLSQLEWRRSRIIISRN